MKENKIVMPRNVERTYHDVIMSDTHIKSFTKYVQYIRTLTDDNDEVSPFLYWLTEQADPYEVLHTLYHQGIESKKIPEYVLVYVNSDPKDKGTYYLYYYVEKQKVHYFPTDKSHATRFGEEMADTLVKVNHYKFNKLEVFESE